VGTRAGLDRCGKSRPPPGSDPRAVQPVASCYTSYATRSTGYSVLSYNVLIVTVLIFSASGMWDHVAFLETNYKVQFRFR